MTECTCWRNYDYCQVHGGQPGYHCCWHGLKHYDGCPECLAGVPDFHDYADDEDAD